MGSDERKEMPAVMAREMAEAHLPWDGRGWRGRPLRRDTNHARRFWGRVQKGDGCWEYVGTRAGGYGRFKYHGAWWIASRLAWSLSRGPIPDGMQVLHRCDNPPCVRPEHLWLGTPFDNALDKQHKGRSLPGERHAKARIDNATALAIFHRARAGESPRALAAEYNVCESTVHAIKTGTSWSSVTGLPRVRPSRSVMFSRLGKPTPGEKENG